MAYYPYAPENGALYTIYNPANGVKAVFNDPLAFTNVGAITDISGLDSPEVRESAEDLVQADGGTHGFFYFSRRPIVITATVYNHSSIAERNRKVDLADRATQLLRGDGLLSWVPSRRVENLIWNPKAAVDLSNHSTSASTGLTINRVTSNLPTGWTTGFQATGTVTTTIPAFSSAGWAGNAGDGAVVQGGGTYSATASIRMVSNTSGTVNSISLRIYWWNSNGNAASAAFSTVDSNSSPTGASFTLTGVGTAPPDAAYATVRIIATTTNPATFNITYSGFSLARTFNNATVPYIDGDTAGYYWSGDPNSSISGDYIEMYTPIRRNGPFRQTGGWNKELNIPLVSEYATLQSSYLHIASAAGGSPVATENRGSWDAYPILKIAGASTSNPTITNTTTGEVFRTTGTLLVASGETLEIDTLNNNAYFTAGARNGQSANRYINFATTAWPEMRSGANNYTLSGTGTLTVQWRDTWV